MDYTELYKLKLGESFENGATYFTRVPGGWVYGKDNGYYGYSTFIPYDSEFVETKPF